MNIQEQLRDSASQLYYEDYVGGRAVDAFKNHLRLIADKVPDLEAAGLEVTMTMEPKKHGRPRVAIKRNGIEMVLYSVWYETYHSWYGDPYIERLETTIETAIAVAKMFAPIT